MSQAASACSSTSNLLQVHHNFRWVLSSAHSEPTSGLLQRYLRRRLIAAAAGTAQPPAASCAGHDEEDGDDDDDGHVMGRVVAWLPRTWQHVNQFLESRTTTGQLTIGIYTPLHAPPYIQYCHCVGRQCVGLSIACPMIPSLILGVASVFTVVCWFVSPTGGAEYCDDHVCLSVSLWICTRPYLRNARPKVTRLSVNVCLWPWLGPLLALVAL